MIDIIKYTEKLSNTARKLNMKTKFDVVKDEDIIKIVEADENLIRTVETIFSFCDGRLLEEYRDA